MGSKLVMHQFQEAEKISSMGVGLFGRGVERKIRSSEVLKRL